MADDSDPDTLGVKRTVQLWPGGMVKVSVTWLSRKDLIAVMRRAEAVGDAWSIGKRLAGRLTLPDVLAIPETASGAINCG